MEGDVDAEDWFLVFFLDDNGEGDVGDDEAVAAPAP